MSEMTCQEVVELVTAYIEGELDDVTEQSVRRHLDSCPGCQTYLAQFRETIDALGELPADTISPDAEEQIVEAFRGWRDS